MGLPLALLPCPSGAPAVAMGIRHIQKQPCRGDGHVLAVHVLVRGLGFGRGSSLYNTDWQGKARVSGVSVCFLAVNCNLWLAKIQQDFIPL